MAGIGDSWGTAQELLHPRDAHGRFRSKWKMSPGVLAAVEKVLTAFRPRTFQSDQQAAQYNFNLANARKPKRFGGGKGFARLQADYHAADEDLRDGNIDEPSTKKFVAMMDDAMIDLPDDVIVSRVVGPDAFGLTPERLPELEEMTGNVIADRGYGAANIGTPLGGGQGMITMIHAVPKGTKMAIPARNPNDRAMFFDRDQEFTVSKVKPDGRGGYNMFVVATPKTPGNTPETEGVGHQGPGTSHDREAAVKGLEDAATKREMGEQPPGALPDQPSEPQSARAARNAAAAPHVPGSAQPAAGEDETARAARRSRILGRPAGPNATPEAQKGSAPAAPAPSAPAVPNAPATPTAAPEANVPNGATSVVTGSPATSFREAAAKLESPSAGPRRREWNSAYQGVVSGKQHPQDMLRELEADIATNKKAQDTEVGRGDSSLAADIEKQEKLADLIRSHFTLGEPAERKPRQEVRNELNAKAAKESKKNLRPIGTEKAPEGKKSATEKAVAGPMSKVAPKRTDGTAESRAKDLGTQREKDLADNALNEEQRSRWADEVGKEPAGLGPDDASGILLDETADLLRNGRTTRPKAAERLREQGRDIDTPAADYLRKVADAIEADTSKPNKRVPLKKRAPKAAPDVAEAEKKLSGRTEKNILTGLNGLTVGELRGLGDKWGVETRGDDKKLKLKAALAKELAAKWKATPELHGKKEGVPEAPAAAVEKKVAKAAVKAAVKKAVPATPKITEEQQTADEAALADAKQAVAKLGKDATPATKALTQIAEAPAAPPVLQEAAKKAARAAEIDSARGAREAELSNPEKKTVSTARLRVGEKLQIQQNDDGTWDSSPRKTGAKTLTVTSVDRLPSRGHQSPYQIKGTDENGNEISLRPTTGQNVVHRAGIAAPKKAALRKDMTKAERDANLPELSDRVLAGEAAHDVVNDIRARLGVQPEPRVTVPTEKLQGPDEIMARLSDFDNPPTRDEAHELLKGVKKPLLVEMAKGRNIPRASALNMQQLREALVEATAGARQDSIAMRGFRGEHPGAIDVAPGAINDPSVPGGRKVPGIDTAARAKIQERAKEVLAELNNGPATDPFDDMAKELKQLPGNQHTNDLVKMAKQVRDEVQATSGPSGISMEDRVAARLLARVKPEYRDTVLAEMSDKDRKHMLNVAERVAKEDARVKVSGHDLDKIMKDSGFTAPTDGESKVQYDVVKNLLANNDVPKAKEQVRRIIRGTDANLKSYREGLDTPGQTQANKEWLGKRITEELARADWAASVGRALESGNSPELLTRKEAQQVIPIQLTAAENKAFTPEALRAFADQQGIKLPEGDLNRDALMTEIAREAVRRELAGKPLKAPEPVALPVKKAAPKAAVEHERIDARTLVPDAGFDEGDNKTLDRIQGLLDGNPEDVAAAGLPKGKPTPAAIGRYVDHQASSLGTQRAMGSLTLNNAKQNLADHPENADYWNGIIAEHEATQKSLQDRMDRLTALATKLKTTRRKPVKKAAAAPAAPEAPKPEVPSTLPGNAEKAKQLRRHADATEAVGNMRLANNEPGSYHHNRGLQDMEEASKLRAEADALEGKPAKKAVAPVKETLARAAKSTPAAKKLPGTNDDVRAARKRKEDADDAFRRAQEKVADLDPEQDNPDAGQLEDDLETARDERDAADEDLKGLLKPVKKAAPAKATKAAQQAALDERSAAGIARIAQGGFRENAPVEKQVAKRAARKEVQAEVAKVVKKAAPKVVESSGEKKYTNDELQNMSLGDLVEIETDRGIKRTSVAKKDRIKAILDQQGGAPEAAKPSPSTPGPQVRDAGSSITRGDGIVKRERPNADEPIHLPNGGQDQGRIHLDSEIGKLWSDLYMDDREPNSFINEIARMGDEMGNNKLALSDFIDHLKEMKKRAADKAVADRIQKAIDKVDSPPLGRKIDVPDDTPKVLRDAFQALADNPMARKKIPEGSYPQMIGNGRFEPGAPSVLEKKEAALKELLAGDSRAEDELRTRDLHEGADSATSMWHVIGHALADPTVKAWLKQKRIEARAKARAEPPKADGGDRSYAARTKAVAKLSQEKPVKEPHNLGGGTSKVTRLEYAGDQALVHKEQKAKGASHAEALRNTDAEDLGADVMEAVGAKHPAVHRAGPTSVYMEAVKGPTGSEGGTMMPPRPVANSDKGRLMGLGDMLAANPDRNTGNYIMDSDGDPVAIDQGFSFLMQGGPNTGLANLFASHFMQTPLAEDLPLGGVRKQASEARGLKFGPNDMTPHDMDIIRTRLQGLEEKFTRLKRKKWFDDMMKRFELIAAQAQGTKDRL